MISKREYLPGVTTEEQAKTLAPWAAKLVRVAGGYVAIGLFWAR